MRESDMKQSGRGRIKSQRKIETPINNNIYMVSANTNGQSTLIRQYDTINSINLERINQLKEKYIPKSTNVDINTTNLITLNGVSMRNLATPILSIPSININQPHITNFNAQAPSTDHFTHLQEQQKQRQIIMTQNISKICQQNLTQFKRKAESTNDSINHRLNSIEDQLMRIKNMRENELTYMQQKQIQINAEMVRAQQLQLLREKEIQRQLQAQRERQLSVRLQQQRQMKILQQQKRKNKQNINSIKLTESIKTSKVQQIFHRDRKQMQWDLERSRSKSRDKLSDNFQTKIAKRTNLEHILVEESNIKLLGEFKQQIRQKINEQFIVFINRLKDQITLDSDFTTLLLSLPSKDREVVKQILRKYYDKNPTTPTELNAVMQFFTISAIQCDPLQRQLKTSYNGSLQSITCKLYDFYLKIQEHYNMKLEHKFQLTTLETFLEQMGQNQITTGHIISYINMRTGKEFRNRALVKLLRRLGIQSYTNSIDQNKFIRGFLAL